MLLLLAGIAAVLGIVCFAVYLARFPDRFFPLLVVTSLIGSGIMPLGYTIIDEVFLLVAVGTLLVKGLGVPYDRSNASVAMDHLTRVHDAVFLLTMAYLAGQSLRGVWLLQSPQKLRWVVFHLGLAPVPFLARRWSRGEGNSDVRYWILVGTVIYLVLYALHGLTAEGLRGIHRYDLQRYEWGTTAYALVVVALGIPAAVFGMSSGEKRLRRLSWACLALCAFCGLYYDSRITLLALLAFLGTGIPSLGARKAATLATGGAIILFGFLAVFGSGKDDLAALGDDLFQSGSSLWTGEEERKKAGRDLDRWVHIVVTKEVMSEGWDRMLFGYGYRTSGYVISRPLYALYAEYLPDQADRITDDESTEGFTALLVETGSVGLGLLGLNFLLAAVAVARAAPFRIAAPIVVGVVILFLWLFIINLLDVTMLYLSVMPSGFFLALAQECARADRVRNAVGILRSAGPPGPAVSGLVPAPQRFA